MSIVERLSEDLDAFLARDPAASSRLAVAAFYAGFHALLMHRIGHWLWHKNWQIMARFVATFSRFLTQVEIHPGATIGRRLVIDHGAGVVIGATAVIDDDVTLYQAVTLGGIAPARNARAQENIQRHPHLCDGVIVGSGAQILGPITVAKNACVGANAVVLEDVGAGTTVVGVPARQVDRRRQGQFVAYGTQRQEGPCPIEDALADLQVRVACLEKTSGAPLRRSKRVSSAKKKSDQKAV